MALAKINDPSFDPILLAGVGAASSTMGRLVLSTYSGIFRRFFSKDLKENAQQIHEFFEKREKQLFIGTFVYALSPFPSNLIFIANGLTKVNSKPIFAGFFLGRLISYFTLIVIAQNAFTSLGNYTQNEEMLRIIFDVFGIVAGFSFVVIDWKKLVGKIKTKP